MDDFWASQLHKSLGSGQSWAWFRCLALTFEAFRRLDLTCPWLRRQSRAGKSRTEKMELVIFFRPRKLTLQDAHEMSSGVWL